MEVPQMDTETVSPHVSGVGRPGGPVFRVGDFVTTVRGYPVLYEVLAVEPDGLVRVRGVDWAAGYSAMVGRREIRPVTSILSH
jgi:hypothetical protein